MKMTVDGLVTKSKSHFSKTESEVCTIMCYMYTHITLTAVELMHSVDYALRIEVSSLLMSPKRAQMKYKG